MPADELEEEAVETDDLASAAVLPLVLLAADDADEDEPFEPDETM